MQRRHWLNILTLTVAAAVLSGLVHQRLLDTREIQTGQTTEVQAVPVEVAAIETGQIEQLRLFSGTLQAQSEFVIAPKISGRIKRLNVDLADTVTRGQVVVRLDNDEYLQTVRQAKANLSVAKANLAEAESLVKIADRELQRVEKLRQRGVSSESQLDTAQANQLAKQAHVEVSKAQVMRAEAELETARIRLGYTAITADWRDGGKQRVVAERYVDEGETVNANTPLLRIVELDPIKVVIFVTEQDYALLRLGQNATLSTDAYPEQPFIGKIVRISPVFSENTRQAHVELRVDNPLFKLKPGMFARVSVVLAQEQSAKIIPEQAVVIRESQSGVFVIPKGSTSVLWRPVKIGIRQGKRIQISGKGLNGQVVTLGQQLLDEGSSITISDIRADTG